MPGISARGDRLPAVTPLQCTEKHAATSKRITPGQIFRRSANQENGERAPTTEKYTRAHVNGRRASSTPARSPQNGQKKRGGGTDQDTGRKRTRPPGCYIWRAGYRQRSSGPFPTLPGDTPKGAGKIKKTYIPETIRPRSATKRDKKAVMQDRKALCPLLLSELC